MKWAFGIFAALYALALFSLFLGITGWLGQERDPLAAVFLVPLGFPWNVALDKIGLGGPVTLALSPAITAAILVVLWRARR